MSLYEQWQDLSGKERTQEETEKFWGEYMPKEQAIYEKIISDPSVVIKGTLSSLAVEFNMTPIVFAGFMDGINTSLIQELDLETLTEESNVELAVDFEKLYYNMLAAKADWLFGLPQWNDVLTSEKRKGIKKEYDKTRTVVKEAKIGRNDPCPCGSGKKYKKCCLDQ
ncbi:MAG: SEC-C domain-containing protein [Dethiosulfatibacter sp.]|nr:SEC-C domain-containing protein [Dethiosulfatibacter sp.]